MRVVAVWRNNTDYARTMITFLEDFARQTGHTIEELDPDTREGELFCRAYDIVEYPSVVALSDDGQMQQLWKGTTLPTISEVSYYVSQG